jgi:hypothetical protein
MLLRPLDAPNFQHYCSSTQQTCTSLAPILLKILSMALILVTSIATPITTLTAVSHTLGIAHITNFNHEPPPELGGPDPYWALTTRQMMHNIILPLGLLSVAPWMVYISSCRLLQSLVMIAGHLCITGLAAMTIMTLRINASHNGSTYSSQPSSFIPCISPYEPSMAHAFAWTMSSYRSTHKKLGITRWPMRAWKKTNFKKALLCTYKGAAHVLSHSASDRLQAFRYTSLHRSKSVVDFFENQSHFTVPKPWLHSAILNTHHTNVVQYDTGSVLIGINKLSSYMCTNSMQDFLPGTYSPDRTKSITGLGGPNQDTTGIGTVCWLIQDDNGALHEFILPNVWFIPSNPICILSPQCLAKDLQDEYHKGTGKMTMASEMVLFWDGRQYKQTICHHLCSKCPLLPT